MLWENSPFTLLPQGAQKKMNRKNWYFIKKKKQTKRKYFPVCALCWFIYVMESLLSLRLCSPGLKQNKKKTTPTSSDKLCLSCAPPLCCGSLSPKNTLAQSSLSIDHPTAEDDWKQRRSRGLLAKNQKKSQPRMVVLIVVLSSYHMYPLKFVFTLNWAALRLLGLTCDICAPLSSCCVWSSPFQDIFHEDCFCCKVEICVYFQLRENVPPLVCVCFPPSSPTSTHPRHCLSMSVRLPGSVWAPCDCGPPPFLTFQSDIFNKKHYTQLTLQMLALMWFFLFVCNVGCFK